MSTEQDAPADGALSTMDRPLKLHLGCGPKKLEGFVNVDIQQSGIVDVVADLRDLNMFPDGCADLIYACHVLEHFGRWEVDGVLQEWSRLLAPGGILRVAVPDFDKCAKLYYENGLEDGLSGLVGLLVGGQRDAYDYHKSVFDFRLLSAKLEEAGMHDIRRWDWRKTEHAHIDDYSQAYLPHMQKDTGTHMSLNVEGKKL
ncbi:MAG: methyltransferase domain-containing protein [Pseudomonadota bacterium]